MSDPTKPDAGTAPTPEEPLASYDAVYHYNLEEAEQGAQRAKAEGDSYGEQFLLGKASGLIESDIMLTDIKRCIEKAYAERDSALARLKEVDGTLYQFHQGHATDRIETIKCLLDTVVRLSAENAALRKDKERLDWLEIQPIFIDSRDKKSWEPRLSYRSSTDKRTLREAIDAALAAQPKVETLPEGGDETCPLLTTPDQVVCNAATAVPSDSAAKCEREIPLNNFDRLVIEQQAPSPTPEGSEP